MTTEQDASTSGGVAQLVSQILPLDLIDPSALNPRKSFLEGPLDELAQSIREHGVLSPLMVRPAGDRFEIIFGERRYRASKLAGLDAVPCRVENLDDNKVLELMIIENAQREDVHPYEEAVGYKALIDSGEYTIAGLAQKLGIHERTVGRRIQMSKLTDDAAALCFEYKVPVASMELASTLAADDQYQALYNYFAQNTYYVKTAPEFRRFVSDKYVYDLSGVIWNVDDAKLLPQAGACTGCVFNSATAGTLFSGLDAEGEKTPEGGRCTKGSCFRDKRSAFYEAQLASAVAKLEKRGLEYVRLSYDYYGGSDDGLSTKFWNKSSKEVEGAQRGIVVSHGKDCGKEIWFKKATTSSASPAQASRAERLEEIRQQNVERAYRFFLFRDLSEKFDAWCEGGAPFLVHVDNPESVFVESLRILVASLTFDQPSFSDSQAKKNYKHPGFYAAGESLGLGSTTKGSARVTGTPESVPHLFRAMFIQATHREIRFCDYKRYNYEPVTLERFARMAGIDLAVVRAAAEQEFAPRKSSAGSRKREASDSSATGGG